MRLLLHLNDLAFLSLRSGKQIGKKEKSLRKSARKNLKSGKGPIATPPWAASRRGYFDSTSDEYGIIYPCQEWDPHC
jgi:hypothetical protein